MSGALDPDLVNRYWPTPEEWAELDAFLEEMHRLMEAAALTDADLARALGDDE